MLVSNQLNVVNVFKILARFYVRVDLLPFCISIDRSFFLFNFILLVQEMKNVAFLLIRSWNLLRILRVFGHFQCALSRLCTFLTTPIPFYVWIPAF